MKFATILILVRRWGLILAGIIIAAGGLVFGSSSHQVTYRNGQMGTVAHYLSGNSAGTGYLQMTNSPTLYIVHEQDFKPPINGINSFGHGNIISFVYTPDEKSNIDIQASDTGTHLSGTAYTIVQITLFDNDGQNPQIFTTPQYFLNPDGYYIDNWDRGTRLLLLGCIVVAVSFLWSLLFSKGPNQTELGASQGEQLPAHLEQQAAKNPEQDPASEEQQEPAEYSQSTQTDSK